MPTSLLSIASSSLSVRYKEPFLSDGINAKFAPQASGVYQGFRLGTSVSNLSVSVNVDPVSSVNLAQYRNAAGRTVAIRTTGNATLDLTAFASKTVVICVYAQYATTATTAAEYRAYELSPSDEFTADPDRDYLVVLGTVEVPAAGLVPALSISNLYRTYAGDGQSAQAVPRIPAIKNPHFGLGPTNSAVVVDTAVGSQSLVEGWTFLSTATTDARIAVATDGTNPGGKVVVVSAVTPSGTNSISTTAVTDVGIRLGSKDGDDWVDVYFEYEVVTAAVGSTFTLDLVFDDGSANGPYTQSFALDADTTGTKVLSTTFRWSQVLGDVSGLADIEDPAYFMRAVVTFSKVTVTAGASYLKYRHLQVTVSNNVDADGRANADPRSQALAQDLGARIIRFVRDATPTGALASLFADGPALAARATGNRDLLVTNEKGILTAAVGLGIGGALETNAATTGSTTTPAWKTWHGPTAGYNLLIDSVPNASSGSSNHYRAYVRAGATTSFLITVNAKVDAADAWTKDTNGVAAQALRITTTGFSFLNQIAGTNSWADGAWVTSGDTFAMSALTSTWADTTTVAATTLYSILNEIVSDLADSTVTPGARRVGANVAATWANSETITGSNVDAVLEQIVADLADGSGTSGADRIGLNASAMSGALSTTGGGGLLTSETRLQQALTRVNAMLVARRGFTAVITDGTNSVGGDLNGANAIDDVDGVYTAGGTFLLRRGAQTYTSINGARRRSRVIGEIPGSPWDSTDTSIPSVTFAAGMGSVGFQGIYESVDFRTGSATSACASTSTDVELRHCRIAAGLYRQTTSGRVRFDNVEFVQGSPASTNNQGMWLIGPAASPSLPLSGVFDDTVFRGSLSATAPRAAVLLDSAGHSTYVNSINGAHSFNRCVFWAEQGTNGPISALEISEYHNKVTFKDCLFICTDTTFAGLLIEISNCSNISFENCLFKSATASLGNLNQCGATFRQCVFIGGDTALGPTNLQLLVGSGVNSARRLVFDTCYFRAGLGNWSTSAAVTHGWFVLGSFNGTTSDTGGSYVVRDCSFAAPPGATALHRGPHLVFFGGSSFGRQANISNVTYECAELAVGGTAPSSYLVEFRGGDPDYQQFTVENFYVRGYGGLTAATSFGWFLFVDCKAKNITLSGVGTGAQNHTAAVVVLDYQSSVDGLSIRGDATDFARCTANYVVELRDRSRLRGLRMGEKHVSTLRGGISPAVSPGIAYIGLLSKCVFEDAYVHVEPVGTVRPLVVIDGGNHAIVRDCTLRRPVSSTEAIIYNDAGYGHAVLNNEILGTTSGASTPLIVINADIATVIVGNRVMSTSANTPTVDANGGVDAGNSTAPNAPTTE